MIDATHLLRRLAGWQTSPWLGLLTAVLGGMLGGLVHAIATVTFGVNHIVSGVAVNLLAVGTTTYLAKLWFTTPEAAKKLGGPSRIPVLHGACRQSGTGAVRLAVRHREAPLVLRLGRRGRRDYSGGLVGMSVVTVIAALLVRSARSSCCGRPRSACGCVPAARTRSRPSARRQRVHVQYAAVIASGGFAGLGGGYLALVTTHIYNDGQTGGRGYIGLAAMIFGNWRPAASRPERACSASPTRSSTATAAQPPCTPCCCSSRSSSRRSPAGRPSARASAPPSVVAIVLRYALTDTVAGVRRGHPVRRHAAGARPVRARRCDAEGRRHAVPEGGGEVTLPSRSTGRACACGPGRDVPGLRPYCRSRWAPPPLVDDSRITRRRERVVRSRPVRRMGLGLHAGATGGGAWWLSPVWTARQGAAASCCGSTAARSCSSR